MIPREYKSGDWHRDYERRESLDWGDKLDGFECRWDADIVSIDGAQYHFYISPKLKNNPQQRKEFLKECKFHATRHGDIVRMSFEYKE